MASEKELTDFLKGIEKRAFKRALYAVRDDEAALDIVQDAMIRLAEKYGDRPAAELPLVFQRILSNATMDWFRRQKVRNAVVQNFSDFAGSSEDGDFDILEMLDNVESGLGTESAAETVSRDQMLQIIDQEHIRRAQFLLEAERFAAAERAQELAHEIFRAKNQRTLAAAAGLECNGIEKVRLAKTEMTVNVEQGDVFGFAFDNQLVATQGEAHRDETFEVLDVFVIRAIQRPDGIFWKRQFLQCV